MREIKFRGKCVETGEWIYGGLITRNPKGINKVAIAYHDDEYGAWIYNPVVQESVGQYTGLDNNGTEIYGGDIYQYVITTTFGTLETKSKHVDVVTFKNGAFMVGIYTLYNALTHDDEPKIIGNIHDNPELLEVEVN